MFSIREVANFKFPSSIYPLCTQMCAPKSLSFCVRAQLKLPGSSEQSCLTPKHVYFDLCRTSNHESVFPSVFKLWPCPSLRFNSPDLSIHKKKSFSSKLCSLDATAIKKLLSIVTKIYLMKLWKSNIAGVNYGALLTETNKTDWQQGRRLV